MHLRLIYVFVSCERFDDKLTYNTLDYFFFLVETEHKASFDSF